MNIPTMRILAVEIDGPTLLVAAIVAVAVLGVLYFLLRYWFVSTRAPKIPDVATPNIDRRNRQALERMAGLAPEADEEEEAPADLKAVVPEEKSDKDRK